MRRRRILLRQLSAIEALGSIDVLCLDTKGMLTLDRKAVVALHVGMQRLVVADEQFLAEGEPLAMASRYHLRRLLEIGALCSEADVLIERHRTVPTGSPTDQALVRCALQAGIDVGALRNAHPALGLAHGGKGQNYRATEHSLPEGGRWTAVKGSSMQVLALCGWYLVGEEWRPLTSTQRAAILAQNKAMGEEGLEILGVAYRQDEQGAGSESRDLCWLGLVGMAAPLRPGAVRFLKRARTAGIQAVLFTSDQTVSARAIGKQLQVRDGTPLEIFDSAELEQLDPEMLAGDGPRIQLFSRVNPGRKLQIVQTLQRAGRVVAMIGDVKNDEAALKAADLGVTIGKSGAEAKPSAADVVLEDESLSTLMVAIREGRTVHGNVRKALHFLVATNCAEIQVVATGIALGLQQPLTPTQLLWIGLIADVLPSFALALEAPEPNTMARRPRTPEAPVITATDLERLAGESTLITAGTLASFGYALLRYGSGARASTQAFMTLTFGQLLHALSCRSESHSLFSRDALPANHYMDIALGGSAVVQLLAVLVPGLRKLLGTTPLAISDGVVAAAGAVAPLLINEFIKKRRARRQQDKAKGSQLQGREFSS